MLKNGTKMDKEEEEKLINMLRECKDVFAWSMDEMPGATYQRMVEKVFAKWVHTTLEVYVDDMLVKRKKAVDHVDNLREIFEQMRHLKMKINPTKSIFGAASGKFLGYIVSKKGIEVDPEKVQAVRDMPSLATIKEVQNLNRLLASLRRFGIPTQIVSDNGKKFEGENMEMLFNAFKIQSGKSTPFYPQSNGQAEATNKTLADILKKKLEGHNKRWCEHVPNAIWAYRTTRREATGMSPFCLTYGIEAVLPTEVIVPTTKKEAWEKNLNTDLILAKLDDLE
ncbi:uncharacterized protein LOC113341348 [Papaver somniferum]|uniref:uncharacterized protein LOC113341348 n=1 Tax=Papaver somniferum TaxID=3469 RepID=UPI000E70494A|nr:uncharacterized protein LOC113341348 [Papaver somniferum]